jgi:hypothetical protein
LKRLGVECIDLYYLHVRTRLLLSFHVSNSHCSAQIPTSLSRYITLLLVHLFTSNDSQHTVRAMAEFVKYAHINSSLIIHLFVSLQGGQSQVPWALRSLRRHPPPRPCGPPHRRRTSRVQPLHARHRGSQVRVARNVSRARHRHHRVLPARPRSPQRSLCACHLELGSHPIYVVD